MFRKLFAAALLCLFCTATTQADDEKKDNKKAAKFDRAKVFERIDADKDGKITKEEYKKFFDGLTTKLQDAGRGAKIADKLGDVVTKSFERLDADKDGKVTKEEFEKAAAFGDLGGKFDGEKLKKLIQRKKGGG